MDPDKLSNAGIEPSVAQLVYRYQSINELTLGNLKRGEYLFSTPSELNDGNEGYPKLILHGDKEAYRRFSYWVLCRCSDAFYRLNSQDISESAEMFALVADEVSNLSAKKPLGAARFKDLISHAIAKLSFQEAPILCALVPKLEQYLIDLLLGDINKKYSTVSFSKSATNPTMWGHYADADRGLVIIHDTHNNKIEVELPGSTQILRTHPKRGIICP